MTKNLKNSRLVDEKLRIYIPDDFVRRQTVSVISPIIDAKEPYRFARESEVTPETKSWIPLAIEMALGTDVTDVVYWPQTIPGPRACGTDFDLQLMAAHDYPLSCALGRKTIASIRSLLISMLFADGSCPGLPQAAAWNVLHLLHLFLGFSAAGRTDIARRLIPAIGIVKMGVVPLAALPESSTHAVAVEKSVDDTRSPEELTRLLSQPVRIRLSNRRALP